MCGAQLPDGTIDVHIAELLEDGRGGRCAELSSAVRPFLVHVVGVGATVIAQPDAIVLHLYFI